jgi:hypothetical protein
MLKSLLFTVLVDQHWFALVLVGSQLALVCSVIALLLIWWVEWRSGRVW